MRRAARALAASALALCCLSCGGPALRKPVALPPPHPEPEVEVRTHVVAPGETLYSLARRYGTSAEALARANGMSLGDPLAVGKELVIPSGEGAPAPAAPSARQAPLDWPLSGVLYAKFGKRGETLHEGIDLAAPEGTPVRAAASGKVLFAGEQRGYGKVVILEHPDGLLTIYAHNRALRVREGETVQAGQPVGEVGLATATSGPHLHFEVREGRIPRDPLQYLPEPR